MGSRGLYGVLDERESWKNVGIAAVETFASPVGGVAFGVVGFGGGGAQMVPHLVEAGEEGVWVGGCEVYGAVVEGWVEGFVDAEGFAVDVCGGLILLERWWVFVTVVFSGSGESDAF